MSKILDGVCLMYVKNNTLYPVALTEEQWNMLQILAQTIANPLKVVNKPLGEALNLLDSKEGSKYGC